MSTSVGAMTSSIPEPSVRTASGSPQVGTTDAQTGTTPRPNSEAGAVTPAPIQPLSNRMLATFLQRDIELYGSMFGA